MSISSDIDTAVETAMPAAVETPTAPASTPSAASPAASTATASAVPAGPAGQSTMPAPASASATETPGEDDDYADVRPGGSIPVERAQRALKNARTKEAARLAAEYGVTPDDWKAGNLRQIIHSLQTEQGTLKVYEALGNDLRARGLIKAPAATTTPAPSAPTGTVSGRPKPSLQAENGASAYTADEAQQLVAYEVEQAIAKVMEKIAPIAQSHESQQVQEFAKNEVRDVSAQPHFESLKPRIIQLMQADGRVTLRSSYDRALREYVTTLEKTLRASLISEMQKAPVVASPALAPSTVARARPSVNGAPRNFDQLLDDKVREAFATH